jgi:hypothetical protein
MITRARRAIPGMVVSVLLASPAWAAQTTTTTEPAPAPAHRKAEATPENRKSTPAHRTTSRGAARSSRSAATTPEPVKIGGPIWSDSGEHTTIWRQTGVASWYGGTRWLRQRRQISAAARRQSCRSKQRLRACSTPRHGAAIIVEQALSRRPRPQPGRSPEHDQCRLHSARHPSRR